MAGAVPRRPEEFRNEQLPLDFTVSELVSDAAGAHSPFGDVDFPLPVEKLFYKHPTRTERPHLADGR
jgi:hypothetical protein